MRAAAQWPAVEGNHNEGKMRDRGDLDAARTRACVGDGRKGTIRGTWSAALAASALALSACDGTSASLGVPDDPGDPSRNFDPTDPGQLVARLRVAAPDAEHFFIRGTIPVPPGTIVEGQVQQQLAVVSQPASAWAITQVETVSRYPDPADGADVIEVIAHVRRPEVPAGTPLEYDVVYKPHVEEAFELTEDVDALLSAPGAFKLEAEDPFGHAYTVDLTAKRRLRDESVEVVRSGPLVAETKTPDVLLPVQPETGSAGTLPRMMGVHSFLRTFARQDYFALDLYVHNAFDGMDETTTIDDAVVDLYFRRLDLVLPQGWEVVHLVDTPFSGPAAPDGNMQRAPIVGPLPGGRMHLMHGQSHFSRRILIAKSDALPDAQVVAQRQNIAFCVDGAAGSGMRLWSWWNEATARYMPQNHRLPDLGSLASRSAVDSNYEGRLQWALDRIQNGTGGSHPINAGNLGWAHPFGIAYGGMTGGERIEQVPGVEVAWAASQSGYRYAELRSRMTQERQPFALVNSAGDFTRYEDHVRHQGNPLGPYTPFHMLMSLHWQQEYFLQDPVAFQAQYVHNAGLEPPYEAALRDFQPIDQQHLTRYTSDLMTLSWLGNDSLAKHQLELCGELFRMTHHNGYTSSGPFAAIGTMRNKLMRVEAYPGTGVDYGRMEAWGIFPAVAAYALGDDETRTRFRPWMAEIAATVRAGQSTCTGNIQSTHINKNGNGSMRSRQAFEVAFVVNALESMRTTIFDGVDEGVEQTLRSTIVDCAYSTIRPPFWDENFGGQRNLVAVGMQDGSIPDFCFDLPPGAGFGSTNIATKEPLTVWAYGYALTGDAEFLQKATQTLGGSNNLVAEIGQLGTDDLCHSAFLLGVVQNLGAQN